MKSLFFAVAMIVVAVALCLTFTSPAQADNGCCGGYGFGGYGGFPFFYRPYIDQRPPYFSQFPPVYYQAPIIPRSYGWSPYPLPSTSLGPVVAAPKPKTVLNPYVKPSIEKPKKETQKTASAAPKVIYNPYVQTSHVEIAGKSSD